MEKIKGITFAPFLERGQWDTAATRQSLETLVKSTAASHVILVPAGIQQTPQAEHIDFAGNATPTDEELRRLIEFAQSLGLHVILKPTVNCINGVWRAYINFFDNDVPGEPCWEKWFASHRNFQLHFAKIAQDTGCTMFIAGCEMVMTQRKATEWRQLIADIRKIYSGPVSYNTDKYQEEHVLWWDAVDVISSSGYYPIGQWETQLDRIEAVVKKYDKPFFFAEVGCMSTNGSAHLPNNWEMSGITDTTQQANWYKDMFTATTKRPWVGGYGLWDWPAALPNVPEEDGGYGIYGKTAECVVLKNFKSM